MIGDKVRQSLKFTQDRNEDRNMLWQIDEFTNVVKLENVFRNEVDHWGKILKNHKKNFSMRFIYKSFFLF